MNTTWNDSDCNPINTSHSHVNQQIWSVVPPILLVLGTTGNVISLVVLSRKDMRRHSTYNFLIGLAVCDTLCLLVGLLKNYLSEIHEVYISNPFICELFTFTGFTTMQYSVWLIVAVTVERYIFTVHPLQYTWLKFNRKKTITLILIILCVLFAINFHFFFTVTSLELESPEVGYSCPEYTPYIDQNSTLPLIWPIVDGSLYSFIPFLVLVTLNVLIIRAVRKARETVALSPVKERGEIRLTIMLMTISFVFLVTTTPVNVVMLLHYFLRGPCWKQTYKLMKTITQMLMYTNHSINFFLYLVSGQRFRQEFYTLFRISSAVTAYSSLKVRFSSKEQAKSPVTPGNGFT